MLSYTTLQTIIQLVRTFFDILILWILLYYTIKIVRNNSRTAQIFKGIVLILIIRAVANFFGLRAVDWLAGVLVTYGFLAIIIIFQPEIRSVLERLGKSSVFSRLNTLSSNERMRLIDELVNASMALSQNRMGALISIEQGHSLSDFIKTGTMMNSLVTAELLQTIFVPSTPLHDGAVIIQGDRIACASAYFPPTNFEMPSRYGARHRAAIGISEITDSVTIVISEKSGRISIAEEGKLITMNQATLRAYLERIILHDESDVYETDPSRILLPQPPEHKEDTKAKEQMTSALEPQVQVKREGFFKTLFKPQLNPIDVVVEPKEKEDKTIKVKQDSDKIVVKDSSTQVTPEEKEAKASAKKPFFAALFEDKPKKPPLEQENIQTETKEVTPKLSDAEKPEKEKTSFFKDLFKTKVNQAPLKEEPSQSEAPEQADERPKRKRVKKAVEASNVDSESASSTVKKPRVKRTPKEQINLEFSVSDASLLDDMDDQNGGENE